MESVVSGAYHFLGDLEKEFPPFEFMRTQIVQLSTIFPLQKHCM